MKGLQRIIIDRFKAAAAAVCKLITNNFPRLEFLKNILFFDTPFCCFVGFCEITYNGVVGDKNLSAEIKEGETILFFSNCTNNNFAYGNI